MGFCVVVFYPAGAELSDEKDMCEIATARTGLTINMEYYSNTFICLYTLNYDQKFYITKDNKQYINN